MSCPVPGQPHRYVHEAVFYDTTQQLLDVTTPLLRQALDQGDDVALVCTDANNEALAAALGDDDRILVLPRAGIYRKAVTALTCFRDLVRERAAAPGHRLCILGEVDFGVDDHALDEWRRYEALLDHALSPFALWSLCGYDTQVLPDQVLATAELTHPYLRRDGMQAANPAHVDPAEMLRLTDSDDALVPEIEPALTIERVLDLSELHQELETLLRAEGVSQERVEDIVIAVHEAATNGLRHGEPPVTVRAWPARGRVVCTVTDRGAGFDDPFAGYLRGAGEELPEGRFGLWLTRQLCRDVVMSRTPEGFTARLVIDY
jgi:anti-sigma regulatory factor (Ser/Thr protein kinase)